jgi:hypothetical protein
MKEILLTQGLTTMVDDEDFEELNQYKWCAVRRRAGNIYAARHPSVAEDPVPHSRRRTYYMHQVILGTRGGDHIDGDGLNNQRENLRACTHKQNGMNRRKLAPASSRYKGVCRSGNLKNPWASKIQPNGKTIHLGVYATEYEAALAYNEAALTLFGEFAKLNEI